MNTFTKLESVLKEKSYLNVLGIRYYNGIEMFSTLDGHFASKTLEGSIDLMLNSLVKKDKDAPISKGSGMVEKVS